MSTILLAMAFLGIGLLLWVIQRFMDSKGGAWFAAIGATLATLTFIFGSFVTIPAGHVGVKQWFGEVQPATLSEGLHWMNPLYSVSRMTTQIQKDHASYDSATQDMQTVHVEMAVNYHVIQSEAATLFKSIGTDYASRIIHPAANEVLKAEAAKYKASEILHQRHTVKDGVQKALTDWLKKYGIAVKEISLSNVRFDKEYTQAIENKQIQEQVAEQKEYELLQAKKSAEITIANAQAKADSLKIEAAALAEYNRKVGESITPMLLQSEYYKKWDGKLPQITGTTPNLWMPTPK